MGQEVDRAEGSGTAAVVSRDALTPVRCPGCGSLLAERASSGALYMRPTRKRAAWVEAGEVECIPCGLSIKVRRYGDSVTDP